MKTDARKILARNVRALMELQKLSQKQVVERLDITQKTVSNVINEASDVSPRLDTIQQLARMFKVEPWQLLLPGFDKQLQHRKAVRHLLVNYLESTDKGKVHIQTVAERELEYSVLSGRRTPDIENELNGDAQ